MTKNKSAGKVCGLICSLLIALTLNLDLIATMRLTASQNGRLINIILADSALSTSTRVMERLGRGLIAIYLGGGKVYVSWRLLGTDPSNIAFNLYRRTSDGSVIKVNSAPIVNTTDFTDSNVNIDLSPTYFVRPIIGGIEREASPEASVIKSNSISIPLSQDARNFQGQVQGTRMIGVGDLDGDGEYDFVVKRGDQDIDPSQSTAPIETYKLEGYLRDGTFLWRVDLGPNIRPGIWYSPFIVFDLDCDGRAEVATKIGEGAEILTSDGKLIRIGDVNGDGRTNYANTEGRALEGPEFFVILDGLTGRILAMENWIERGSVSDWGDSYGNRCDRHLMGVAYLDGYMPSLLIMRGTYTKMYIDAWNWRNGTLTKVWRWYKPSGGGGFHNIRVGDIDGDGKDEIVYGSIAVDHNGATMWETGEGHGDRMHMTDIDPTRPGLEIWYVQEAAPNYGMHLRDARNGSLIWGIRETRNTDVGRGLAADIDPRHYGLECWASVGNLYNAKGQNIGTRPAVCNFAIWWDGDLLREHLDATTIAKWNYLGGAMNTIFTAPKGDVGSRNAPMGYGDILGDWREEVWYGGSREFIIYITTTPAETRMTTLMHDSDYRTSVACETMGYMQATQPSFYIGAVQPETRPDGPSLPLMEIVIAAVAVSAVSVAVILRMRKRL
ncbi:MAG: rhamnogalacturonan lyase [Nitrososphaerota archaeon]|nr:rhamnogalacturonan lyase [Candidatus Bathyarchaeota archaeon]MDW8048989.1 rhamnogalacturonan lyase [Nitrososphaerota archaeon]